MLDRDEQGWRIGQVEGDAYEERFDRLARAGQDVHGEASLVESLRPRTVLDAGCGTGRVARELARRGIEAVGVDVDSSMLATARRAAPDVEWYLHDLATLNLQREFDIVLLAGNVMIFLQPGSEGAVLQAMARHLAPSGLLISGFQLGHGLSLERYDALATAASLRLRDRWATWDRALWEPGGDYAVSVHERGAATSTSIPSKSS